MFLLQRSMTNLKSRKPITTKIKKKKKKKPHKAETMMVGLESMG